MCNPKNLGPGKSKKKQNKCNQKCEKYATSGNLFFCKTCTVPEFAFFFALFVCLFCIFLEFLQFFELLKTGGPPKNAKMHNSRICIFFTFFLHFPRVLASFWTFEDRRPSQKMQKCTIPEFAFFFTFFCFFVCFFFNCIFACMFFAVLFACCLHFLIALLFCGCIFFCLFWLHFILLLFFLHFFKFWIS